MNHGFMHCWRVVAATVMALQSILLAAANLGVLPNTDAQQDRGRCNVDVRNASSLSLAEFQNVYYLKRPVIIQGSNSLHNAVQFGVANHLWSTDTLVEQYGSVPVTAGSSGGFTFSSGGEQHLQATSIRNLFSIFKAGERHDWLAFDRGSPEHPSCNLFNEAPHLVPAANALWQSFFNRSVDEQDWIFSASGRGGGVHFHQHSDAYCILFAGQKRWFLYPPNKLPALSLALLENPISMQDWYKRAIYPKLREDELPVECLQLGGGEVIYIPEMWWHATLQPDGEHSPTTTVGVASSVVGRQSKMGQLWVDGFQMKRSNPIESISIFSSILEIHPDSAPAWWMIGQAYELLNADDSMPPNLKRWRHLELRAKEAASQYSNGRNCDVLHSLGSAYLKYGERERGTQTFQECQAVCGHFRKECTSSLDALLQQSSVNQL